MSFERTLCVVRDVHFMTVNTRTECLPSGPRGSETTRPKGNIKDGKVMTSVTALEEPEFGVSSPYLCCFNFD